jgi:phosphoribosylformylglycinamidine synthase I
MRFAIVQFPGTNCDHDCFWVVERVLGRPAEFVWHTESDLARFDVIVLPGGFAHGDYLRPGAIARFSPVMAAVEREAQRGKLVVGICNGFQILLEAGLLPGAMLRNESLEFRCQWVHLRVENDALPYTALYRRGQVLRMPIAHGDGNYFADAATLAELERNGQVVFRYCTPDGRIAREANPNGSLGNIAGICNREGNVFGMMPHPERCSEAELGGTDGLAFWRGLALAQVLGAAGAAGAQTVVGS